MMKQSIKNLIFIVMLISISSVLSSCTNSGGSTGTLNATQSSDLKIDKSSSIPVLDGNPTTTGIYIHNTTNHDLSGISYQVLGSSASSHLTINQSSCTTIKSNSSCLLSITTPSVKPLSGGGDVIIANYNGTQSSQMINYNYVDSSSYNGVSFANANVELIGRRDYATVYAFVGSSQSATNVVFKSSNNSVGIVNGLTDGGTNIGSNQVLPLEIVSSDNITATNVAIIPISDSTQGSKNNQHLQSANNNLLQVAIVPTATGPNLIMSNVGVLTQANPEVTVTVYNSGNSLANNINLYSQTLDITVIDGANSCSNNIIPAGNSCNYILRLDTTTNSGSDTLTLAYNGTPKQMTVYYQNLAGAPMVGIAPATSQLTVGTSSTESFVFNVHNYGIRALNNPVITPISQVTGTTLTETSNDCGNEINPNETCQVITSIVAGSSINSGMMYLNISGIDSNNNTYSFMSLPVSVTLSDLPPKLVSTTPSNTESNVSQATGITLNFNEPMDPLTLSDSNIQLFRESDDVAIALTSQGVTNNNQTVSLIQSSGHLDEFTSYKVVINPSAITDSTGLAMDSGVTESTVAVFTTGESIAPTITDFTPSNGATNQSQTPMMSIQFSEAMDASSLTTTSIMLKDTNDNAFANYNINYDVGTYTATIELTNGAKLISESSYNIRLNESLITDVSGNKLGVSSNYLLTTFGVGDYTAPTINSVVPVNGTSNISLSTSIIITFSESMDTATLTNTSIKLYRQNTASYVNLINPVYNNDDKTVTLTPSAALNGGESYDIIINPSLIKDKQNNVMESATSLTISQFVTTPPVPLLVLSGIEGMKTYNGTTLSTVYNGMNSLNSVTYGNGMYVAVGGSAFVAWSIDGLNWEHATWSQLFNTTTTGGGDSLNSIAYGNGKFVAVGSNGLIAYSSNGTNWVVGNSGVSTSLNSVIYANNQFVAIGGMSTPSYQTNILTSSDGVTWSAQLLSGYSLREIAYDSVANMYIVYGESANNSADYIISAANIADLNQVSNIRKTIIDKPLPAIISYNGITILSGYDGTLSLAKSYFYRSTDAVNFTESVSFNLQPTNMVYDTVIERFIALGCYTVVNGGGCSTSAGVSISNESTGISFGVASQISGKPNSAMSSVFANNKIVAVTQGKESQIGYYGYSITSTDGGSSWTVSDVIPNMIIGSANFAGGYYIGVNTPLISGGINGAVWSSADGMNWTRNTTGFNQYDELITTTYSNGNYLVLGKESDPIINRKNAAIYRASDPSSWTKVIPPNYEGKTIYASNAIGNLVVAVGLNSSNSNYLITSTDGGLSWTDNSFNVSGTFLGNSYKIANNGSRFVAVGYGSIYYSDDGINWTDTGIYDYGLYDITYSNGKFIAVGDDAVNFTSAVVISSTNGTTWTKVSSSAFNIVYTFYAVGYYKNTWYVAGVGGAFLKSTNNGATWSNVFSSNIDNTTYVGLLGS